MVVVKDASLLCNVHRLYRPADPGSTPGISTLFLPSHSPRGGRLGFIFFVSCIIRLRSHLAQGRFYLLASLFRDDRAP